MAGVSLCKSSAQYLRDFPYDKLDRRGWKVAVNRAFSELAYKGHISEHVLLECKVDWQMHPFVTLPEETEIASTGWIIWVAVVLF